MQDEVRRHLHATREQFNEPEQRRQFNQLMRDLENDFYIIEISEDRFDFASGLMQVWWQKYYA